ncbi:sugar phosphate isomerase/epimerase family protein [Haloarcula amylovorans]|uniref:sugar phosphate isomerase/epimerase family protein n=1 Tax=Haloarcula amylovorans TaxID=2562280 RepID=UPI0010764796|nr:sugar phosphate isomerase/epimerase [Halomicroarcula amylolytica]
MGRPIRISVPRRILSSENPVRQEYLSTIAEMNLSIELFTPDPPGGHGPLGSFLNEELYNESAVERASQLDLDVESVHCTPLLSGCSSSGAKVCADKVLDAQLGFQDQDSAEDTDDGGVSRYSYCDPSVFVFHPPRTYANENADLQRRRKQLVATLGNARLRLENNENLDSVPILTIENVCPRGPFEYLLTEAPDVPKFEKATADLQREQPEDIDVPSVQFTVDLGHAPNPLAMLDAVGRPAHVHLHGSIPITETDRLQGIRDKYGIDDDALLGPEEPPGEIQHLPPQDGRQDVGRMVDTLDSSGYSGPVVLELAPPFRTSETLRQTIDALRTAGW